MIRFETVCQCGNNIAIQVDTNCTLLNIHCRKCNRLLVDHREGATTSQSSVTISDQDMVSSPTIDLSSSDSIRLQETTTGKKTYQIDDYTIVKSLGKGASGNVLLGIDNSTQEKVAIKVLEKHKDPKAIDSFLREAQILMQLKHPNIVKLKNRGNFRGKPYLVMSYISGVTLAEVIERGPITPINATKIIYLLLNALEYAAQYQIIHRDVKPDNVFIGTKGEVKLIDLGLGKILDGAYGLTMSGEIMGTPFYMPQEQIMDAKRASYQADIYAVGATLYHMLCGSAPYSEYEKNINGLLMAKMKDNYMRLAKRNLEIPRALVEITEKAMSHKLEDRYQSAREMRERISLLYQSNPKE